MFKASATGKKSEEVTKFMSKNYSHIEKGIFGAIRFALKSLCIVAKPDPRFIEVSVTSLNRPFEVRLIFKTIIKVGLIFFFFYENNELTNRFLKPILFKFVEYSILFLFLLKLRLI